MAESVGVIKRFREYEEEGEALMRRLFQLKYVLGNAKTRPKCFADKAVDKVLSKFLSKFPDLPDSLDKISGWDGVAPKVRAILDELEGSYYAMADLAEWRSKVVPFLSDMASKLFLLKLDENPGLTELFFGLLMKYFQLHVVLMNCGSFADRKAIVALYARLFQHLKSKPEPLYPKTGRWLAEYGENPGYKMYEDCRGFQGTMGTALMEMRGTLADISNVADLRKKEALNITLKPGFLGQPTNDFLRHQLTLSEKLRTWILFGMALAPVTAGLPRAPEDLLQPILVDSMLASVAGDVVYQVHSDLDDVWGQVKDKDKSKQLKNFSKFKKMIKDELPNASTAGVASHRVRRTYLRQELETLTHLFTDTPALIAPKITIAIAALTMARNEILWYFRHRQFCGLLPKKMQERKEEWVDNRVAELVHWCVVLAQQVRLAKDDVTRYYTEFIAGADRQALQENAEKVSAASPQSSELVQQFLKQVDGFCSGHVDMNGLAQLQDMYLALEHACSMSSCATRLAIIKQFMLVFRIVAQHATWATQLDSLVDQASSLRDLFFCKEAVQECFENHLKGDSPAGCIAVASYIKLLADHHSMASMYWPEEKTLVGQESAHLAVDFCDKTAQMVRYLLQQVTVNQLTWESQLREKNAFDSQLPSRKDWKPPKDWVAPVEPASESTPQVRPALEALRVASKKLSQIIGNMCGLGTIVIFDTQLVPAEFYREVIQKFLIEWLRTAFHLSAPDNNMERPSEILRQLQVVLWSTSLMEHQATLGLEQIWRDVMLSEFQIRELGMLGAQDVAPMVEIDWAGRAVGSVVKFYSEFFMQKIPMNAGFVAFSPSRRGFFSKTGCPFKAEMHCDVFELKALTTIIGPYGVKAIESWLMRYIVTQLLTIKEVLITNAFALEEIAANYSKDAKFGDVLKKLRDMDVCVAKSIALGNALAFRSLLKEALGLTIHDQAPYIANAISAAFNSYARNTFIDPLLLRMDFLASECGIDTGSSDQALKASLKKVHQEGDQKMWKLLPVLYAVMFTASQWKDAVYLPQIEAHSNNVHLLARVINDLIVGFCALVLPTPDEKQIALFLTQFVEISAMLLLRMARNPPKPEKGKTMDFPSVIIFIDKFIDACPLLSRDVLEDCLPYTLLRNMFKDVYSRRTPEIW